MHTCTHIHTHLSTHSRLHTCTRMHTHTRTRTHTLTHTHTHAYEQGTSPRKYKKLPIASKRWLAVNAIIRVDGLEFEGGQREPKSGLRVLKDRSRELIEACNA